MLDRVTQIVSTQCQHDVYTVQIIPVVCVVDRAQAGRSEKAGRNLIYGTRPNGPLTGAAGGKRLPRPS
jgi:hypothetical protein